MSENTAAPAKPKGKKRLELDPRLAAYKGIWVFVEMERGYTRCPGSYWAKGASWPIF